MMGNAMCVMFPMFGRCRCWAKRRNEAWRHRRSIRCGYAASTRKSDPTHTVDIRRVPGAEFDAGYCDVMHPSSCSGDGCERTSTRGGRAHGWTAGALGGGTRDLTTRRNSLTRGIDWVNPNMYLMGIELILEAFARPTIVHQLCHIYRCHVLLSPLRAQ